MTQNQQILNHFRQFGTITPKMAIKKYGIMRLAARIQELEKSGYPIKSRLISFTTRLGKRSRYALYYCDGAETDFGTKMVHGEMK